MDFFLDLFRRARLSHKNLYAHYGLMLFTELRRWYLFQNRRTIYTQHRNLTSETTITQKSYNILWFNCCNLWPSRYIESAKRLMELFQNSSFMLIQGKKIET